MNNNLAFKFSASLLMLLAFSSVTNADHSHQHIKSMGIDVYMMVMPAEIIGGYPKDHPETLMHRSERRVDGNQFHISIGVLEEKNGRRIQNLEVSARIIAKDYLGPVKKMGKMTMQGEPGFGNYFVTPDFGAYKVEVKIQHVNQSDALIVTFEQAQV